MPDGRRNSGFPEEMTDEESKSNSRFPEGMTDGKSKRKKKSKNMGRDGPAAVVSHSCDKNRGVA
jgi:hypothetical protein